MIYFSFLCHFFMDPKVDQLIANRKYLDAGLVLKSRAESLEDPVAVFEYTDFLTEFYGQQVGFRTFFVKNLFAGERLDLLRSSNNPLGSDSNSKLLEKDLENLLLRAEKKFPGNLHVKMAHACYAFRGACCFLKTKIKLTRQEVTEIFEEGAKNDIFSSVSFYGLAMREMTVANPKKQLISDYLLKAHKLSPENELFHLGFINDLLENEQWTRALSQSKALFNTSLKVETKVDALTAAARAHVGLGQCSEALEVVSAGLDLLPKHSFLWFIGLDCTRKIGSQTAYELHVNRYLDQVPTNPGLFKHYLDFLRIKGKTKMDDQFIEAYKQRSFPDDQTRLTQKANLGLFYLEFQQWSLAAREFKGALEILAPLGDAPPGLDKLLQALLDQAREKERNSAQPSP